MELPREQEVPRSAVCNCIVFHWIPFHLAKIMLEIHDEKLIIRNRTILPTNRLCQVAAFIAEKRLLHLSSCRRRWKT